MSTYSGVNLSRYSQADLYAFAAKEYKRLHPSADELDPASTMPSTVVKLNQGAVEKNLTYENIKAHSVTTWGSLPLDPISLQLSQNLSSETAPDRLNGLGEAVLGYFESETNNFSQSLISYPTPDKKIKGVADTNATYNKLVQERLMGAPTDQVVLSIQTKSGVKVDLQINSLVNTRVVYDSENSVIANGLSVDIKASAELSQPERDALVRLAAGFEHAIQGLNLEKTKTDIEELLQFDSSIFESIDLKAKFNDPADSPFSFEFHADMNQRHLNIELSKNLQTDKKGGKLEIDVNLKEPELFADESKKNKAMDNYLKQIDQTAGRAKSKEVAIDIFKQSLISAHQLYPAAPAKPVEEKSADKPIAVIALDEKLADQDLAVLSGMADFKAGLNIEGKSNPFRPAETVDHLKYDMSQETIISGKENRHVGQVQKSDLDASVHTQLDSSKAVQLTENKYSQSYDLHRMKDHAESVVSLDYEKNNIIKASIEKSADQSSQFERFILGKQTKEKHSSLHNSVNDDLLPLLEPLVKTAESGSSAYRTKKLLELNQNIELENNPDLLKITKPR